jgi:hypothetical protein
MQYLRVLVPLLIVVAPAKADLTFNMTLCGGSYQPCVTTGEHRQPAPAEVVGLGEEAFYEYFRAFLPSTALPPLTPGMFSWSIAGSAPGGIVIGRVDGISGIHTGFVFRGGKIVCCTLDDPFALLDMNIKGVMAGTDEFGLPALFRLPSATPTGQPALLAFQVLNRQFTLFGTHFLGVDNLNRVFGSTAAGQAFVLDPTVPAVPEPGSIVLLATALLGVAVLCRRSWRGH